MHCGSVSDQVVMLCAADSSCEIVCNLQVLRIAIARQDTCKQCCPAGADYQRRAGTGVICG